MDILALTVRFRVSYILGSFFLLENEYYTRFKKNLTEKTTENSVGTLVKYMVGLIMNVREK